MPSKIPPPYARTRPNALQNLDFATNDPDHFVETMELTAPGISLELQNGPDFSVRSKLYRMPRLGFFATDIFNARVNTTEARDFISLTIPVSGTFEAGEVGRRELYETGSAFFLDWDKQLGYLSHECTPVHVLNIDRALFLEHLGLCRDGGDATPAPSPRLDLKTPEGAGFLRYLNFLWSELCRGNPCLDSPHAVAQIENWVTTLLALVIDGTETPGDRRDHEIYYPAYLKRAEEYLEDHAFEPVSLAELARMVGVSVRTLNRAFKNRYGVGPISLLKRHRLAQVRRALLAADPAATTVTQTALSFGIQHLSQFATDYRKLFGELPSETLRS